MKIKINDELIDFKIIKGDADTISIELENEAYTLSLSELLSEGINASTENTITNIKAFGTNFTAEEVMELRNKELKIHAPTGPQIVLKPQTNQLVAAIMKAHQRTYLVNV